MHLNDDMKQSKNNKENSALMTALLLSLLNQAKCGKIELNNIIEEIVKKCSS